MRKRIHTGGMQQNLSAGCQTWKLLGMKYLYLLFAGFSIFFLSCSKADKIETVSASLEGSWRMIAVKENTTGIVSIKNASLEGNVEITFLTADAGNGHFVGKTPTNDIWLSEYITTTDKKLNVPCLSMTKVMETDWGLLFVENIRSAELYQFETNGNLIITTALKTLTFKRL